MIETEVKECRLCNCSKFHEFVSFGQVPLANDYKNEGEAPANESDLTVLTCDNCGLFQLKTQVDAAYMFSDYSYATSKGLEQHFKEYALSVIERLELDKKDLIVEIGGNSGVLAIEFKKLGYENYVNVEPAANIAKLSEEQGINTLVNFFSDKFATSFVNSFGMRARVVIANNVLAHLENYQDVFNGIQNILEPGGYLIFENAYWLNTLSNNDFGQIYSEHSCYHLIAPLFDYFQSRKMTMFYVDKVPTQNGSFRAYVKNEQLEMVDPSVLNSIMEEYRNIFRGEELLKSFVENIASIKQKVQQFFLDNKDKKIGLVGCTAKSVLLLKYFGIEDCFYAAYDDAPLKIGKLLPGTRIKIKKMEELKECDICFLGAYNFKNFIINRFSHLNKIWACPLPQFTIE